eukprot:scaffold2824_cov372-Prasinococcus_capsulatus_cf.AAC.1
MGTDSRPVEAWPTGARGRRPRRNASFDVLFYIYDMYTYIGCSPCRMATGKLACSNHHVDATYRCPYSSLAAGDCTLQAVIVFPGRHDAEPRGADCTH